MTTTNSTPTKADDPLVQPFLDKLAEVLPDLSYGWTGGTDHNLEIVGICADVKISVWFDGDEYTVGIGELFHTHFETYLRDDMQEEERRREAASEAVAFIKAFIDGEVELSVTYKGNEPTRCSARHIEEKSPFSTITEPDEAADGRSGDVREVRYTWRGRVP